MKKDFSKTLKNVKKNVVEYVLTNRLFISYCILALIATICIRKFTINSVFRIKPLITDLGLILLIGSFGYFVKPKNQFKYYFTWLIVFNLMCLVSSIYYRFFTSFASIGELATVGQTETVKGSIFDRLKIYDFIYIIIPIIFYLIHKKLLSSVYYSFIDKIEKSKKMFIATFCVGVVFVGYSLGVAKNSDYSRLAKQWNRLYIVERFGIIMYQVNDFVQYLTPQLSSLFGQEKATELFNDYFNTKEKTKENKYTGVLTGKNIVFVHMESMQSFLMNLSFNGKDVTPNLKRLAKEGMHFTNFYPQVSTGTSSDTEFTLLTGLIPASSGTVFVSYYDRNYFTIPKYLASRGYETFSMHGNLSSMWNRNKAHPSLGYNSMYFGDVFDYTDKDVINLGINDSLFFKEAIPMLENIEKNNTNYMGTVITLSNHSPFKLASMHSNLDLTSHYEVTNDSGITQELEKDYLELSEFHVEIEHEGSEGAARAIDEDFDLILLDLMLPGMDGFEICKLIREKKNTPIIMVSAKKEDIDKIRGLGLGADDYMTKPFSPSELVARVKAHLSRYKRLTSAGQETNEVIEIRDLVIDKTARRVILAGEEKTFTTKEFDLLTFLAEHPNHVYSKEELFKKIWEMESVGDCNRYRTH